MRFFLSMVMEVQHFQQFFHFQNERIIFNGAKFKIKVDLKEKITERYPGEVDQGICRCGEREEYYWSLSGYSVY